MRRPAPSAERTIQPAHFVIESARAERGASEGPSDHLLVVLGGCSALWVLTWAGIQLHQHVDWALPALPGLT